MTPAVEATPVVVPTVDRPDVSIVIVTYGQWSVVRDAIATLVANTSRRYELIVVDNASPDGTGDELARGLRGARLFRMPSNVGFGNGATFGAGQAVGQVLCFLNSDAFVEPGWLEPLVAALDVPGVGAAIPAVLEMDGRLQEAGSVVGHDGSTWPDGVHDDPARPAYRFGRVVDYGSAVCLVMRRSTFLAAGGFDARYRVAYYEDVDLAFDLGARGQHWWYEPASRVRHVRHASSSHDVARALMLTNRQRFVEKWSHVLDGRPPIDWLDRYPHRWAAARDAPARHRVLLVHDRVPDGARRSTDQRAAAIATTLARRWVTSRVTLLAVHGGDVAAMDALLAAGVEVVTGVDVRDWLARRRFHYDVVVTRPSLRDGDDRGIDALLDEFQPQAARVCDVAALTFRRLERRAATTATQPERWRLLDEAAATRERELATMRRADAVMSSSEEDTAAVAAMLPDSRVFAVGHAIARDDRAVAGLATRANLLCVADDDADAAVLAARELLPLLRAVDPDLRLSIVGADIDDAVRSLAGDAVDVVDVADRKARLSGARLLLAPHRHTAGAPPDLVEAMSAGLPFVTTPIGAEGLALDASLRAALVGERVEDMARLARRLMRDEVLWADVQRRLLAHGGDRFGEARLVEGLVAVMAEVGVAPAVGVVPSSRASAGIVP